MEETAQSINADIKEDFYGELEPIHFRALVLLVAGRSIKEISEELGLADRTIQRWKLRKDFRDLLYQGCARAYEAAIAELVLESSFAAKELIRVIREKNTPPKTRLTAIGLCLKYASEAREFFISGKLEKIEKMLAGGSAGCIPETITSLFEKPEEEDTNDDDAE